MVDETGVDIEVTQIMEGFCERTGVGSSEQDSERYLWTDAFGVLNLLALRDDGGGQKWGRLASQLVDDVHGVLGKFREGADRSGWLSAGRVDQPEAHPTAGGLRIGKRRPERPRGEPIDRREEWDRDGQYFHYNMKWALALGRLARLTGEKTYRRWAVELMEASHDGFVYESRPSGELRMYWKMRTDLSEPLVESMGQLDPLDGWVTCRELMNDSESGAGDLESAARSFESMLEPRDWRTSDPLGLGGVLMQAYREYRRLGGGSIESDRGGRLAEMLEGAVHGLEQYEQGNRLGAPSGQRLAFREFGLAIGLRLAGKMADEAREVPEGVAQSLGQILEYEEFQESILNFWADASHRESETWRENRNINEVMMVSALLSPEIFDVGRREDSE